MSFEMVEKLEIKVQQAMNTIIRLKTEVEQLEQENLSLLNKINNGSGDREALVQENKLLKQEQTAWQERLRALLGKMEEV